ncbi:NodT family efflux transporter outer membrane factor (OMF) lipoprotein [Sphingobium sp. B7D2B]|uniref:efflux transporter outer membrane subunit n=1 Tax=Sphingobium sp. B7D2B TaxID=2940583 RepID=UPI002223F993|nr:efflux transporter outer membrane subunit [Sphingobium sp. B7D2B]MCW2367675.1 NodT family efflux transporter outer membrane factor (OMF) lipoprotein [Sphingobium sp. B7D2B]
MATTFLSRRAGALLAMLALPGCAAVPHMGPAPAIAPADHYAASQSLTPTAPGAPWVKADWWTSYGDPQLDGLIQEALAGSPDLAVALARVRRAEAIAQQSGAARLPSLDVSAGGSAAKQSYNNGIPPAFVPQGWNSSGNVQAALGFDLDLWGRNRAAYAAARSDAEAAQLDYQQAALMLSTNVADAYADLARLFAQRAVLQTALEVREKTQGLVSDRVTSGLDTQAELKQASAAVPAARSDLAATDEQIGLARNRLAALLGAGPDRGLAIMPPAVTIAARGIPENVTTDLVGRRPDIAAARVRVEAEASRIKVARADFYPAINLSAIFGFQSLGLSNLFKSGSDYGSVGPAITLPIFRGGALQGQYKGARAGYDEAVASYDRTVTDAYRAVADAVVSQRALAVQLEQSRKSLADFEAAYAIATQRYEGGLSTFLDVLTAQDRALQAKRTVADLQARAFTLDVALVRALGGGFTDTGTAAQTTPTKDATHG